MKKLRIIIDIVMYMFFIVLMGHHITGNLIHEILGTGIIVLFIIHNLLNIKFYMENHELSGKTMIPFCTSGGSGIQASEKTLKSYNGINWISGKRLTNSKNDVTNWVKSLNY